MEATSPASAKIYTKFSLNFYDFWVLQISNQFFWKCPTRWQLKHFEFYQTENHLDVGVGTGYYLKKSQVTSPEHRLALMDINRNSLSAAEHSLLNLSPEIYIHDVLKPTSQKIRPFDSISLSYLLHCLGGPMSRKGIAFRNLKPLLNPGGVLFGSTILGKGKTFNLGGRALMNLYNQKGIFGNLKDSKQDLEDALRLHFKFVHCQTKGHVALFSASDRPIKPF